MAEVGPLPPGTPDAVRRYAGLHGARVPVDDPTLGRTVVPAAAGTPRHRLVALGDSLTHGFQSGAVFNTDLSYPAIIAAELGWDGYRCPHYPGRGGLPLNLELVLRDLEDRFGSSLDPWELPLALFRVRDLMDEIEDYWERGPGSVPPLDPDPVHALAVFGWDLRDVLERTAESCAAAVGPAGDDLVRQVVEHAGARAALRVYPSTPARRGLTLLDTARLLGDEHDEGTDAGIETLVVLLGANNALGTVTSLRLAWSEDDCTQLGRKDRYTMWQPDHFTRELALLVEQVRRIGARHVIWGTVPHVTIAPIARGFGGKLAPGSRYFPFYGRPWVGEAEFDPDRHDHLTGEQARAVDVGIDMFNDAITAVVDRGRAAGRDWYLFDLAGLLDRLASRRYVEDPSARPAWWTPYSLPPALAGLDPVPDSRFLTGDGRGGRATGGLFSLDGVHPTTVGYGLIAQEVITIMSTAGVDFHRADGTLRPGPVQVDVDRLVRRDTLLTHPPQNLTSTLGTLGWADTTAGLFRHALVRAS